MRASRFIALTLVMTSVSVAAIAANDCKQIAPPGACRKERGAVFSGPMGLTVATENGEYVWDETEDALEPFYTDFVYGAAVVGDMEFCFLDSKYYEPEQMTRDYGCVASISNPIKLKSDDPPEVFCKRAHWACPTK